MFPLWTNTSSLRSSAFIETAIKRERHLVPKATLQLIYRALIHPHFNYCNTVWLNCGITLTNKLQKLQNRAARVGRFQTTMKTLVTCLNSLMEKSSAPCSMKLKKPRWFISLYTGWLQNIYVLGLQYEKRHITLETLRINFASLYHGQIITKIALAIVAPSYGTNSH